MPNYQYECKECNKQWSKYHDYDETPLECPFCKQNNFKKIYNYTTTINKLTEVMDYKNNNKVGQKTRDFIEESRKELQEQKEQMRGK